MALLALDIGAKRTGVALSTSGQLVTSLGVWETLPWAAFVDRLSSIIHEHGVTRVIVGKTTQTDSQGSSLTDKLTTSCPVPVEIISEHATTTEARRQTGRTDHADDTAAALILERYLEENPQ